MKVSERIAALLVAIGNCSSARNHVWKARHEAELLKVVRKYMPSGSGVDTGTRLDLDNSSESKLVFHFGFHHMNDVGVYDGWTWHTATAVPTFTGTSVHISGDELSALDYLVEAFIDALEQECGNVGDDI